MLKVALGFLLASFLWGFAFKGPLNFWLGIFIAGIGILIFGFSEERTRKIIRPRREDLPVGILSGIFIYSFFFAFALFVKKFLPDLYTSVEEVKALKNLAPIYFSFPVALTVSVGEEVFWRGFVQRTLMENLGKLKGYLLSILLYSLAHAFTFNLSLMVAAIGAGAFWGFLFIWKRDLTPLIISHITWDVLLFTFGM
jgi:membrane protease YdiL (CAAX protease family)